MVTLPQPVRLPVYDWPHALSHLAAKREELESLRRISPAGVDISLMVTIQPLEQRYDAGERSAALYEAMLAVKARPTA